MEVSSHVPFSVNLDISLPAELFPLTRKTIREIKVRRAALDDVSWILDLSARVQQISTSASSKQIIGPVQRDAVESTISRRCCYILEDAAAPSIGSVVVAPLPLEYTYSQHLRGVSAFTEPLWLLQSLMVEPSCQGCGAGVRLVAGVLELVEPVAGTVFLDC